MGLIWPLNKEDFWNLIAVSCSPNLLFKVKLIRWKRVAVLNVLPYGVMQWSLSSNSNTLIIAQHRITEYSELEGTHKDNNSSIPGPVHAPESVKCSWALAGLGPWSLPWGACSSGQPPFGWRAFSPISSLNLLWQNFMLFSWFCRWLPEWRVGEQDTLSCTFRETRI